MKDDKQKNDDGLDRTINKLSISDEEIKKLILKKKIMDYQVHKVKSMSLQQLIEKTRNRQGIYQPPSPTEDYSHRNMVNSLKAAGFQHNLQEIARKQMQMVKDAQQSRKIQRKQMRQAPIFHQIKRGKLGMDSVLILFAIVGSFTLPYIFYKKFEKNRASIISSRKYSPQVIENLSDDSPIDIDSVSQQSVMYENPERKKLFSQKMKQAQKFSKLRSQLDL